MINSAKHLAYTIKIPLSEIYSIIDNIDEFYYEDDRKEIFTTSSGIKIIKSRILYPSIGRLKVAQKRILLNILQKIPLPTYAFGAVKGKSNILNGKKHQGNKFFFLTDIKKFFPSINNQMVFETLRYYGFSPTTSRILTQLMTYKGMVPQGTPTSSYISNLVFYERVGKKIESICKEKSITFTSFIDDLTLSSKSNFKEFEQEIIGLVKEAGFRISHKKTFFKSTPPDVTGVIIGNNSISPSKKTMNKLKQKNVLEEHTIKGISNYVSNIKKINHTPKKKLSL